MGNTLAGSRLVLEEGTIDALEGVFAKMDARGEFVSLAAVAGANVSLLCKRFGISRKTGYKWLSRSRTGGGEATCVTYVP